jgi:SAM-dependent methyltransferase
LAKLEVKANSVLDVGGGSNPVKGRVKSWEVGHYEIFDSNLEESNEKIDFVFDINDRILKTGPYNDADLFDVVFCLEVFDYVYNPVTAMKNLYDLTKTNGTLIITFPFVYPNHNPVQHDFLRYTKQGAIELLGRAGFTINKVTPRLINHTGHWLNLMEADGYRYKGAAMAQTLFDSGYIIEATKK